jgi:hypothetical protein
VVCSRSFTTSASIDPVWRTSSGLKCRQVPMRTRRKDRPDPVPGR